MRAMILVMLALAVAVAGADAQTPRKGLPKKSSAEEKSCFERLCYGAELPGCGNTYSTCCFPENNAPGTATRKWCTDQCVFSCLNKR
jgi:hypothetical protein